MRQALRLGLAGLLVTATTLRGQERIPSPTLPRAALTTIPLRPLPAFAASSRTPVIPAQVDEGEPNPRVAKMARWTLLGALAGGTIAYYTYKGPDFDSCSGFQCADMKPRMIKGALIGGAVGLTVGVSVIWRETRPRLELRSAKRYGP